MKVTGIGGVMFRAKEPKALSAWYEKYLGINGHHWQQKAGPTAFAPTDSDSDYFGKNQQFILNFRVDDLKGFLKELKASKVKVTKEVEKYEGIGLFAWIEDPEGNAIELWEPSD